VRTAARVRCSCGWILNVADPATTPTVWLLDPKRDPSQTTSVGGGPAGCRGPVGRSAARHFTAVFRLQSWGKLSPKAIRPGSRSRSVTTAPPPVCARAQPRNCLRSAVASFRAPAILQQQGPTRCAIVRPAGWIDLIWKPVARPLAAPLGAKTGCRFTQPRRPRAYRAPQSWACWSERVTEISAPRHLSC